MRTISLQLTSVALALVLAQWPALAAGQAINEQRNISANEKIEIEVQSGDVRISAVSAATFTVKGELDERATGFELQSDGGNTRFVVKMPRQLTSWGSEEKTTGSRLEITVPVGAVLRFSGVNTEVSAKGVTGGSRLKTVNGTVTAEALRGDIQLETVNGEIISSNNQGRLQLQTVNGSIKDVGSAGRLTLESVNGEIDTKSAADEVSLTVVNGEGSMELSGTKRLEFSSVNGEIEATLKNSKAPKISASSVSGSTKLKLDADISARFDLAASAGGSIDNKLTADKAERTSKYGPGRKLNFTTGSGEGEVEISTVSGDIELEKH